MSGQNSPAALIVLIPGLWMPSWVMLPLAWRLRAQGYACVRFGYPSARGSLQENADRLAGFLRTLGDRPLHLVGHSLGGVLALHTAASRRPGRVLSVLMMGSPARGSFAARRLLERPWGRWMVGRMVPGWLQAAHPVAPQGVAVGVIAGTRALGLGMIVAPDLPQPHDGVITVAETAIEGAADRVEVAVSHAAMLTSSRVAKLLVAFLRRNRFLATASQAADPAVAQTMEMGEHKGKIG